MRDVAGVPTVTREQAQRVATASPATPLVGHRGAGSSHGRGWRAHGRRRAGWACLLPCEELAGVQASAAAGTWQLVVVAVAVTVVAATGAETAMVVAVAAAERQRRPQGRIVGRRCPPPLSLSGPPAGGGVGMRDVKKPAKSSFLPFDVAFFAFGFPH